MKEKLEEEWKDIENYPNYQISNLGRVRNKIKNRIIKPSFNNKTGYLQNILCKNNKKKLFLVHRLVAEAFIPNPENKTQVNHKDRNKENNKIDNLEWVTISENIK